MTKSMHRELLIYYVICNDTLSDGVLRARILEHLDA